MKNNTIYLAYGSNLNLRQMAHRCPTAEVLGTTELRGYNLKFRGHRGNGVATVEPGNGAVPALIWAIKPKDEAALDIYEGWPHFYRKETVTVEIGGKAADAMVYIMNDGYDLCSPSNHYFNAILQGYAVFGFDPEILNNAREMSMTDDDRAHKQLCNVLAENLKDCNTAWLKMSPSELIANAHEIALTMDIYNELASTQCTREVTEYLLTRGKPLVDVRDYYTNTVCGTALSDLDEILSEMLLEPAKESTHEPEW